MSRIFFVQTFKIISYQKNIPFFIGSAKSYRKIPNFQDENMPDVPPIGEDVMQIKGTPQNVSTKQMCIATIQQGGMFGKPAAGGLFLGISKNF